MADQLSQHGSGRVCGKKLPCSHPCSEGAGSNHVCVCNRKCTVDPGCSHQVTGTLSNDTKIGSPCLEPCGKVLDCGHPGSEPCNSGACICRLCFNKQHVVVTSDSDDANKSQKSETKKTFARTKMVANSTLKVVSGKVSSKRKNTSTRFSSSQFSVKKVKVPKKAGTSGNGLHGLQNDFDSNKPCSSRMAYGNGSANGSWSSKKVYSYINGPYTSKMISEDYYCSAIPQSNQPLPIKIYISLKDARISGTQLQEIPEIWLNRLKHMMSHTNQNNENPDALDLAHEREVTVIQAPPWHGTSATPVHVMNMELHMGITDENSWRLGYDKCVNSHYFRAELRKCDTCGKTTGFRLPGFDSDSDSD